MKITEQFDEMVELGKEYVKTHPEDYSNEDLQMMMERFGPHFEMDKSDFLKELYAAIYCEQVYGTSIMEYGMYGFKEKGHSERIQYVTWHLRYLYMAFLNRFSENHILDSKYEAYTLLKPFYKREAMLLSSEVDYPLFCSFVQKHSDVFVKPNNLELAEGAHRLYYDVQDLRSTFDALLKEAATISSQEVKREIDHRLILEEFLVPSSFMRTLNPNELSVLRVTTIFIKGKIHFFYPCLRLLWGDGKEQTGEDYSYDALIDPESGEVVTNGITSYGEFETNPITGLKIRGMIMPEWKALKEMLIQAAKMLPSTRYIGWDVTHTDKGWCIIEGNTNGEFFFQMCAKHGVKEEFENLIRFKVPYDFWKNPQFQKR